MSPWPSTVGLAIYAAYWLLLLMFILAGLASWCLVAARGRQVRSSTAMVFVGRGMTGEVCAVGTGISGHPYWALGISLAVLLFAVWWMNNLSRRE